MLFESIYKVSFWVFVHENHNVPFVWWWAYKSDNVVPFSMTKTWKKLMLVNCLMKNSASILIFFFFCRRPGAKSLILIRLVLINLIFWLNFKMTIFCYVSLPSEIIRTQDVMWVYSFIFEPVKASKMEFISSSFCHLHTLLFYSLASNIQVWVVLYQTTYEAPLPLPQGEN